MAHSSKESSTSDNESPTSGTDTQDCRIVTELSSDLDDEPVWRAGDKDGVVELVMTLPRDVEIFRSPNETPYVAFVHRSGRFSVQTTQLWKVDCQSPSDTTLAADFEGVDFTKAMFDWEREFAYAPEKNGLVAWEVGADDVHQMSKHPKTTDSPRGSGECRPMGGVTSYVPADVPAHLLADKSALIVARGGPCGYESGWRSGYHWYELDDSGKNVADRRKLHWPTDLEVASDGTVWLVDGAIDTLRTTRGFAAAGLLKSDDGGQSWQVVASPDDERRDGKEAEQPDTLAVTHSDPISFRLRAARVAVASDTSPDELIIITRPHSEPGIGNDGGAFLFTDDGGESWWRIRKPKAATNPEDVDHTGVWMAEARNDNLEKLRIWTLPRKDFDECEPFSFERAEPMTCPTELLTAWQTADGAKTWSRLDETPEPPPPDRSLQLDSNTRLSIQYPHGRVLRKTPTETSVVFDEP